MSGKERNVLWVEDDTGPDLVDAVKKEMDREVGGYVFHLAKKAKTPDEARVYFVKFGAGIDLILMDIVWRDAGFNEDGIQLAYDLLATYERPVVYLTGQWPKVRDDLASQIKEKATWQLVMKGFEAGELGLVMAQATDTFRRSNAATIVAQAASYLRRYLDWGDDHSRRMMMRLSQETGEPILHIAERIRNLGRGMERHAEFRELRDMFE